MQLLIALALLLAAASVLSAAPSENETSLQDVGDTAAKTVGEWAKSLYAKSDELKEQLVAYRQTQKDLWKSESSWLARGKSAALKALIKGFEAGQEWFKEHILNHPEKLSQGMGNLIQKVLNSAKGLLEGLSQIEDKETQKEIEKIAKM